MGRQPSGIGLGFRFPHADAVLQTQPAVPWFEVIADDLLCSIPRQKVMEKLRAGYPVALHAVGINIAGADPLDESYLLQLRTLADRFEASWLSDHLCWSASERKQHFDLLPMPFSEFQLRHVASRVHRAQEILGRPLLLENISYYVRFDNDEMSEWDFHARLCEMTGCQLLLDVNNLWSNAKNFARNPYAELQELVNKVPAHCISQIHLAGSTRQEDAQPYWIDTHGEAVPDPVVQLFNCLYRQYPQLPAIIERDNYLPAFEVLQAERQCLQAQLPSVSETLIDEEQASG